MRLTIDIDEKVLRGIQKATGNRKRSPAVREALERYLRERERRGVTFRSHHHLDCILAK